MVSVITKYIKALTYVLYEPYQNSKLLSIKTLEAAYLLLLLSRRKKKMVLNAFSWAKNTARGGRFLLRFSMYLF